jgi:hypothetical protein
VLIVRTDNEIPKSEDEKSEKKRKKDDDE